MNVQIKKINILSILFSGFSVVVFFVALFSAIVSIFITPSPIWAMEAFKGKFIAVITYTLVSFIISLAFITFLASIYNFFIGIVGMRGIEVELEQNETEE